MAIAAQRAASPRDMGAVVDGAAWQGALAARLVEVSAPAGMPAGAGRVGVVMGLHAEAECLGRPDGAAAPLTWISGGSALRARRGAEQLQERGVAGLVSFGLAIGLAPVLRPGW